MRKLILLASSLTLLGSVVGCSGDSAGESKLDTASPMADVPAPANVNSHSRNAPPAVGGSPGTGSPVPTGK